MRHLVCLSLSYGAGLAVFRGLNARGSGLTAFRNSANAGGLWILAEGHMSQGERLCAM